MLKRDFVRRLNRGIIIFFLIFVVFLGVYFFISFTTQVSAIRTSITIIQETFTNETGLLTSIRNNLTQANFLFIAQLIIFIIAVFGLLGSIWYTTRRYLVEKKNALVDSLTQLYNKKAILFHLRQELLRSERYGHPTTVAILDLDYFKRYNDTNGHVAGDNLLKRIGRILHESVREYDEVGRFGGEEFIIVFPETYVKDAAVVCERIRKIIEETRFVGQQNMPNKKITISVGLAEIKGKKKIKQNTILRKADEFLYKAKQTGRNQVLYKK
jgi:diguanylate cyclase (GGDEF)-like protein